MEKLLIFKTKFNEYIDHELKGIAQPSNDPNDFVKNTIMEYAQKNLIRLKNDINNIIDNMLKERDSIYEEIDKHEEYEYSDDSDDIYEEDESIAEHKCVIRPRKTISPIEVKIGRSEDYYYKSEQEQWAEDEFLGILDWDGTNEWLINHNKIVKEDVCQIQNKADCNCSKCKVIKEIIDDIFKNL